MEEELLNLIKAFTLNIEELSKVVEAMDTRISILELKVEELKKEKNHARQSQIH
jgi:FtsZ-binding cell division protein ZapB